MAPASSEPEEEAVRRILAAYGKSYWTYYIKNGQPTNEVDAMRLVIGDVKKLYGTLPASQFGPKALKAVRQARIDRGRVRAMVNKNMRRITRIFRWAVAEKLADPAVYQALAAVCR